MTVNPGDARRKFIDAILPKIWLVRQMIGDRRPACELAVEVGIDRDNAHFAVDAGADVLVAGASIFGCPEGVEAGIRRLFDAARGGDRGQSSARPFTM